MSKFRVNGKVLNEVLKGFSGVPGKTSTIPVLKNLKVEVFGGKPRVYGTDLEAMIRGEMDGWGDDVEPFLVNKKDLVDAVKGEKGEVDFAVEKNELTVSCGGVSRTLGIRGIADFPVVSESIREEIGSWGWPTGKFQEIMKGLLCVKEGYHNIPRVQIENRPEGAALVSMDDHRLHIKEIIGQDGGDFDATLLIASSLTGILKLKGECDLRVFREILGEGENKVTQFPAEIRVSGAGYEISWVQGSADFPRFPNWRRLIYTTPPQATITVKKDLLADLCLAVTGGTDEHLGALRQVQEGWELVGYGDGTKIKTRAPLAVESFEGEFFPGGAVGFNLIFLHQAVARVPEDFVCLKFWNDPMKHFWVGHEDSGVWAFVMSCAGPKP